MDGRNESSHSCSWEGHQNLEDSGFVSQLVGLQRQVLFLKY